MVSEKKESTLINTEHEKREIVEISSEYIKEDITAYCAELSDKV